MTFENVLSQSPKTTPSHMTMLTSLYPCEHGIELWPDENVAASVLSVLSAATAAVHRHGPAPVVIGARA